MTWAYGVCFLSIFLAELPDKTSILVMTLAPRQKRLVWLAASAALSLQAALAVAAGRLLAAWASPWVHVAEVLLLLGFAAWLWFRPPDEDDEDDEDDEAAAARAVRRRQLFLSAFLAVFVAEFGDLTQVAILSWSTRLAVAGWVWVVSSAALVAAAYVSATAGVLLRRVLSLQALTRIGAVAMAAVGVWMLLAGG